MQLNVLIVYFASGVKEAANDWKLSLWAELDDIVVFLQCVGEPLFIVGDFSAHIEAKKNVLIPLPTKKTN